MDLLLQKYFLKSLKKKKVMGLRPEEHGFIWSHLNTYNSIGKISAFILP